MGVRAYVSVRACVSGCALEQEIGISGGWVEGFTKSCLSFKTKLHLSEMIRSLGMRINIPMYGFTLNKLGR